MIAEIDTLALVENDPKRFALLQNVETSLHATPNKGEPAPKLVIFSEYADTVKYLEPALKEHFPDRVLVSLEASENSIWKRSTPISTQPIPKLSRGITTMCFWLQINSPKASI